VLIVVYASLAIVVGALLFRRALLRPMILLEELALAFSWSYVVGGALWLRAWVTESSFLGFVSPWTWLTASHFHVAGFGALTVSALATRMTRSPPSRRIMHVLLLAHPVLFALVAAGINGASHAAEVGAIGYLALFVVQLALVGVAAARVPVGAVHARGVARTIALGLLILALAVPVATLVPAVAWSVGSPLWNLEQMIRYHGIVNALGHVVVGLVALAILRPKPLLSATTAPFSKLRARGAVGADFLARFAPAEPKHPTGLSDDLAKYGRQEFAVTGLHPQVRAFYEHTSDFELDVEGRWRFPFRLGGWFWARIISPRLGQLGLPSPRQTIEGAALDSQIVDVDDALDGRSNVRGWVRTWRANNAPIYVAAYAEHERNGVRYMNIAFPLPGACLTSILHLSHADGGGLSLTSRHHEHLEGDQGIYLSMAATSLRLPMDETIVVFPVTPSEDDPDLCLEARHDMWLFGLRFLTLRYRIRTRSVSSK